MTDQNLAFLNKFISIYQELIAHDGFGDIAVNITLVKRGKKEIRLKCGREYRYRVNIPENNKLTKKYRVVDGSLPGKPGSEPENRSGKDRRDYARKRRCKDIPRNFKLERRLAPDRRSGRRERRKND